ncbi:MAG: hypothetical protein L6R40_002550 [Gallowayella cf. fulva]|nr:MAG: hypothetical protein L6R40_002550 [Xanthomendoza cf. fulva]
MPFRTQSARRNPLTVAVDLDSIDGRTVNGHFNYQLNVTICSDGTVCPQNDLSTSANTTCCDRRQGRTEIQYHNDAEMPRRVAALPSYYAVGNYTIPTDGQYRSAVRSTAALSGSSPPLASITSPAEASAPSLVEASATATISASIPSTPINTNSPPSTGLTISAKIGTGVGVAVSVASITILLWYIYVLRRRSLAQARSKTDRTESREEDTEMVKPELQADVARVEASAGCDQRATREYELSGCCAKRELGMLAPAELQ